VNVKELREALKDYPDDMEVIIQEDPEGNGYSPLDDTEESWYETEVGEAIHPDDYDPEDYPDAVKVVVLWPVN